MFTRFSFSLRNSGKATAFICLAIFTLNTARAVDVETLPDAAEGGGQYHVVVAGSLNRDGEDMGPMSIEFASPAAGAIEVAAGSQGLELVLARFPRKTI